jgi:NAD(P)-dependent dehydrogenase (short-subunit alcohol dehydrogenase family)
MRVTGALGERGPTSMFPGRDLIGKTILITGGSSGIGHAMAAALIAAGGRVAIVSRRNPNHWDDGPLPDWDPEADLICADVSDTRLAEQAVARWLDKNGGGLDTLVVSAVDYGSACRHSFSETTTAEWDALFNVNVRGVFLVLHAVLPYLLRRSAALVVGITSDVAFSPGPFRAGYAASKAAARALFDSLSAEMADQRVNVVQLLPARQVVTPGLRRRRPDGFDFAGYMHPSEFAEPICRLVRDLGAGLNGQMIKVGAETV